jgi:aspartate racemase
MSPRRHKSQPVIGVIGGMGPEATVDLMRRVIEATPASDDSDHIRMIVDNNPKIPSRMKALIDGAGEDPAPVLAAMARGLETAGADVLVIPCNTAHHYLPAIRAAVRVPVTDMIALSVARLQAMLGPRPRIGLLASPAIRLTGQFERGCGDAGIEILHPAGADEAAVLAIIKAVKANAVSEAHKAAYRAAAQVLVTRGAVCLVVACTELSVLEGRDRSLLGGLDAPVLDTLDVLVDDILERCGVAKRA